MDGDSWSARLSSASRRYQSALQSRSDMFMGFEEIDGDDDIREEFPCPFCSEYFDIVGLCCHIDEEHPVEAKNGVCPVCAMRVGVDMVAHITLQHGNIFKISFSYDFTYMQRKRKSRKGGSHSTTLSLLRKELREGNLQSLFGGSSCIVSSSNVAADPLLSSFILPMAEDFVSVQPPFLTETSSAKKSSIDNVSERKVQASPLSIKDKEEKAKRCEFVHGLLLSTILDDSL
ncbi:Dehydration-induced protein [Trema orientale]|uniref:Dehydration-induced protein n=1 Tax=Trema orientale TaxID=63057 RepID=A0A2P5EVH1_TREOI|nr:Dehydration-induced protein [Trema orientale]